MAEINALTRGRYDLGHRNNELAGAIRRLDARLGKDRRGGCDPEFGLMVGPGLYEEICAVLAALTQSDAAGSTPAAEWRERGEADPHGDRYDCPRERLMGGHLTDDQVAFQTAMIGRHDLDHEVKLTVAKDRIRWLSRRVVALEAALAQRGATHG